MGQLTPRCAEQMVRILLAVLALLPCAFAGYALPGVAPHNFADGEVVDLQVARIDSVITQMPFPYYTLPFCQPETREFATQHMGASLRGDRIEASAYELSFEKDEACKLLCHRRFTEKKLKEFESKVREGYRAYWLVDNLPAATRIEEPKETDAAEALPADQLVFSYERGFEIGSTEKEHGKGAAYLNNHVRLTVKYHKHPDKPGARIVAFEVEPFSVEHKIKDGRELPKGADSDGFSYLSTCKPLLPINHSMEPLKIDGKGDLEIIFTYDVVWVETETRWASRWDMYLLVSDDQVHWFSVFNSLVTVVFLTGMVGIIFVRTLNTDISAYNEIAELVSEIEELDPGGGTEEDTRDEAGWKLLHADVFRPPQHANLLSAMVGSGCQLFCAASAMLVFACLGFVSPSHRGGLMTVMLLTFVMMGTFSGYFSARNYKMLGGTDWKTNTMWAAFLVPSLVFVIFFLLNLVLWSEGSSGAVPFATLAKLLFLVFGVHGPLCYLGGYFGAKRAKIEFPCRTNLLPRALPKKEWYMHPVLICILAGFLPFGAIFVEVTFVLSSIWLRHYYYVFGFMLLVFIVLTITCSEICIVLCYTNLCNGDYDWSWRAFLTSGSCAAHVFLYSIFYYHTQLNISKTLSMFLYFGYNLIMAIVLFILTGTIGYQATLVFVRKIFASIKVD